MRNGFNQLTVPYMNELTAGQLNAASVFGGNMPVSFINWSLGTIGNFLDQKPKFCADASGRVVPCDSPARVEGGSTSTQGGGTNNPTGGAPIPQSPPITSQKSSTDYCYPWDITCLITGIPTLGTKPTDEATKDALGIEGFSNRLIIIVVGIAILLIALFALSK